MNPILQILRNAAPPPSPFNHYIDPATSGRCAAEMGRPSTSCPYAAGSKSRDRWESAYYLRADQIRLAAHDQKHQQLMAANPGRSVCKACLEVLPKYEELFNGQCHLCLREQV